jgi:hypothetical protein
LVINEQCTEAGGAYADKSLALWLLADLPLESTRVDSGETELDAPNIMRITESSRAIAATATTIRTVYR